MKHKPMMCLVSVGMMWSGVAFGQEVRVSDVTQLKAAISQAQAGQQIILEDGVYKVDGNISCRAAGEPTKPIVVKAANKGGARIEFNALEGFKVGAPHWHFEDLHIKGVCGNDSSCEHAWHVVGAADGTVIRGNKAWNFNAQIKANGEGDPRQWPDDVLVAYNEFYNEAPRQTSNPVTPIDVVGGRRWRIVGNYIHDFAKAQGNTISYAAFLKGNSRDGLFERNLVVCEQLHQGQLRLGLSFGGGGTGPDSICEEGSCTPEHQDGVMRNNIIANCTKDVGVYINKGARVRLEHNLLFGGSGVDVRFDSSSASFVGNVLSGRLRERDGGKITDQSNNMVMVTQQQWTQWFEDAANLNFNLKPGSMLEDAGQPVAGLVDDYCGAPRDAKPDIGPVERSGAGCDTTTPFHEAQVVMPGEDMGAEADMGVVPDMGGASDMGAGTMDMGTTPGADMGAGPAQDMGTAQPGADLGVIDLGDDIQEDDDCSGCASSSAGAPKGGAWLLVLAGLIAGRLRRQRRRGRANI